MTTETVKDTKNAGRVRARLIDDIDTFGRNLLSELEHYGDCFTGTEVKTLRQLVVALKTIKTAIDTLEDRRLGRG